MNITKRQQEEGECVTEIMAWLDHCIARLNDGKKLQPDPFYERNGVLTLQVVQQVIADIEGIIGAELKKYPGYHYRAQGVPGSEELIPPGFDQLPGPEQFAVVQGIDKVCCKYRDGEPGPSQTAEVSDANLGVDMFPFEGGC